MADNEPTEEENNEGVEGSTPSLEDMVDEAVDEDVIASEGQVESDFDALLTKLQHERDEYLDVARRLQADFENYKKRTAKQMQEHTERAGEVLVSKLLDVLDTIDLALHHEPSGPLEHVAVSLREVLQREGLKRIESANVPFDPEIHDAVAHEDSDSEPEVIEVMRDGYLYKGKVISPAMVKVKGNA